MKFNWIIIYILFQISVLSEDVADCPRLKVLRLEENCIEKGMITPKILKHSQIALLAIDGNLFPAKDFPHMDGYEEVSNHYWGKVVIDN